MAVTTAKELLAPLRPFGPVAEGGELVLDFPPELEPALRVLHTGVRALLSGSTWFGCGSDRRTAGPRPLDPAATIPEGITLLCVEGDRRWDRIDPCACLDLPHLFAPAASSGSSGPRRK